MREPLETAELLAFTKTVDAKSQSRAALELGIPRATLNRRLTRLEERLSVRLLRRTTRSLVLTDAGEVLYRHARIVLDAARDAEASLQQASDGVRGDLRVSLPPMGGESDAFLETLAAFAEAYPQVRFQAHFSSRLIDLRRDGYDVAIRATSKLEPGLVARTLVRSSVIAVASKRYLKAHGTPTGVRDLKAHRCFLGFARGELPMTHVAVAAPTRSVAVDGAFFSNDPRLLITLAARGLGIAFVPALLAASSLARGDVVPVLPKVLRGESRIAIVYLDRELMPPAVRAFVDWMAAHAPKALAPTMAPTKPARSAPRDTTRESEGPRRPRAR